MSLSDRIVAQIPELRRFARALCGDQQSGDALVAATLKTIAEEPSLVATEGDLATSLFRVFCGIWQTRPDSQPSSASGSPEANADQRLASLVPLERLILLLNQIEGFSEAQIAMILDTHVGTVAAELEAANADIAAQLESRILIIEDEPLISMDISRLVASLGHAVTSIARTHDEALAAIARERPGLVIADVQLADGSSGIDAVNDILREYAPPVIFITGHPELLLTGERPEPTFLLSKPYDPDEVKAMISQVLFFQAGVDDQKVA